MRELLTNRTRALLHHADGNIPQDEMRALTCALATTNVIVLVIRGEPALLTSYAFGNNSGMIRCYFLWKNDLCVIINEALSVVPSSALLP
jgi:hypothetical protein